MRLLPVPLAGKCQPLNWSSSNHPVTFGFQASSPPNNIIFKPTSKKIDQKIFRLAFVYMFKPFLMKSSLFLGTKLHWLIKIPLYSILMEGLLLFQRCINYLPKCMTFWTMPCLNGLVLQLVF